MDNTKSTRWVSRVEIMERLTNSDAQARFRGMTGAEAYNEFLLMVTGVPTYDLMPAGACYGCTAFWPCSDEVRFCRNSNTADCPCEIGTVPIGGTPNAS